MNVALLCNEYPPRAHGGIGTSVQRLAHQFASGGHRAWVLGWSPQPENWRDQQIEVELLPATRIPKLGWWLNRRRCAQRLYEIDRAHGLDLVECPDWEGLAAWQSLPCPLIVRLNGSDSYFGEVLGQPVPTLTRLTESNTLHRARSIASVSNFCWQTTRRIFDLDRDARIIPNSVDCSAFRPDPGRNIEADSILYLGTIARKKGVFSLFRAFERVIERHPRSTLLIAGRDNPDRQSGGESTLAAALRNMAPQAAERVRYLGAIGHSKIPRLLQSAHVCCLPSYAEALPVSWIETMACATPLVASTRGPGPEVAQHGKEALLIDPDDTEGLAQAILTILEQPGFAERLGKAARARCLRRFDSEVVFQSNLSWYQEVIESNGRDLH